MSRFKAASMGDLGLPELLVIALLAVFLFGSRRIPEIAKGLGEGIRSFKTALRGGGEEPPGPSGD
jgi:sec-independent protein translocase protein TatA